MAVLSCLFSTVEMISVMIFHTGSQESLRMCETVFVRNVFIGFDDVIGNDFR
jgi:hypothetical protein